MDKEYKKYQFATSTEWEFAKTFLYDNLKNFALEIDGNILKGYIKCIKTVDEWATDYERRSN